MFDQKLQKLQTQYMTVFWDDYSCIQTTFIQFKIQKKLY